MAVHLLVVNIFESGPKCWTWWDLKHFQQLVLVILSWLMEVNNSVWTIAAIHFRADWTDCFWGSSVSPQAVWGGFRGEIPTLPSLPVTQWPAEWPEVQHSGSVTLPPPSKHTPLSEPERAWHAKRQGIGMIKRDQPENRKVFYVPTHPLPKLWNNSPAGVWLFCYQTSLKVSRVEPRLNRSWFQVVSVFKKGVVLVMFFWSCKLGHFHQFHYESVYLLNSAKRWLPTSYQVITAEICSSVEELPVCQRLFSLTSSFKRHHTAVCCSLLFTLRLCS